MRKTKAPGRQIKTFGGQKLVWPIKDKRDIERFMFYLLDKRDKAKSEIKRYQADRNWMLCLIGFNTAFRAEDLLQLRVVDIMNGYVSIKENKTGKMQNYRMRKSLHEDIQEYIERNHLSKYDYMFLGQKKILNGKTYDYPITRQQGWQIITDTAKAVKIGYPVGLHSLRKTFGYQYYASEGSLLTLAKMYNHDSTDVTLLYIMWDINDAQSARTNIYIGGVHQK